MGFDWLLAIGIWVFGALLCLIMALRDKSGFVRLMAICCMMFMLFAAFSTYKVSGWGDQIKEIEKSVHKLPKVVKEMKTSLKEALAKIEELKGKKEEIKKGLVKTGKKAEDIFIKKFKYIKKKISEDD